MNITEALKLRRELGKFVKPYKEMIGRSERMHWCEMYMSGLMINGERKSIEPMAARLPGANAQSLQQFINQSPWEYEPVMKKLAADTARSLGKECGGVLVLDDTSLPKKGDKSVGVARQYCGALGKIANCQNIVSWHYSIGHGRKAAHIPLTAELYIPREWAGDQSRMKAVAVPKRRLEYVPKTELALKLLKDMGKNIPHKAVVWDAWYGESREFRKKLDALGEKYVGGIPYNQVFWANNTDVRSGRNRIGRPRTHVTAQKADAKPVSARTWGGMVDFKLIRLKTISKKHVLAAAIRVREADSGYNRKVGAKRWLVIEKENPDKTNYYISNLPENASLQMLIDLAHQRAHIEQGYQRLKEELGLDHFEGRSWIGLHHHITLCFMAYDFIALSDADIHTLKKTDGAPFRGSGNG